MVSKSIKYIVRKYLYTKMQDPTIHQNIKRPSHRAGEREHKREIATDRKREEKEREIESERQT